MATINKRLNLLISISLGILAVVTIFNVMTANYRPLKRTYLPQSTRQSWAAKIELYPPPEGPVIPLPTPPPPPPPPPTGYQALVSDLVSRVGLVNLWVLILAGLLLEVVYAFWWFRKWKQSRTQKPTRRLSEPS